MSTAVTAPAPPDSRRWRALGAIAVGQFMIAVDATIMNISLPSAQRVLHLSDSGAQWVITVFALCYGGLLLLGGRLSDLIGRRNCLLIGLAGFAAASVLGGAAVNPAMLLLSRALQGLFGALFTPSALALLGTTFTTPAERGKAFGIYGTVMGSSSGIGLMLGGVLTDTLGWRWSMYVSVPIAVAAAVGIAHAVRPAPAWPEPGWTSPARSWPPPGSWRWSSGSPGPAQTAGPRPHPRLPHGGRGPAGTVRPP